MIQKENLTPEALREDFEGTKEEFRASYKSLQDRLKNAQRGLTPAMVDQVTQGIGANWLLFIDSEKALLPVLETSGVDDPRIDGLLFAYNIGQKYYRTKARLLLMCEERVEALTSLDGMFKDIETDKKEKKFGLFKPKTPDVTLPSDISDKFFTTIRDLWDYKDKVSHATTPKEMLAIAEDAQTYVHKALEDVYYICFRIQSEVKDPTEQKAILAKIKQHAEFINSQADQIAFEAMSHSEKILGDKIDEKLQDPQQQKRSGR